MKSIFNLFNYSRKRKSIPNSWCGLWKDINGKQLIIESTKHDFFLVTVLDTNGELFEIELLGGNKKKTKGLIGRFTIDTNKNPILQVEAGSNDIGPTYDLYFLTHNEDNKLILANNSTNIEKIIIRPNVGIGLYDDWEDDLGVPWADPLEDFKK